MLQDPVTSSPTFWSALYSWFTPTVFFIVLQLVIATIYITSSLTNTKNHNHHHQEDQNHHQGANFPHQHQHPQLVRSPSVLQRLKSINFNSYPFRSQDPFHHPQTQTHENEEQHHTQIARSPSILQRIKSINLYSYIPTEPFSSRISPDTNVFTTHEIDRTEDLRHVAVSEEEEEEAEDDDVLGHLNGHHEEGSGGDGGGDASMDEIYMKLQGQGHGGNFTRTHSDTKPASGEVPVKLPRKMKKSASSKSAFGHFKEEDIVESRRPATAREAKPAAAPDDDGGCVDAKADDFINKFKQQLKLQRLDSIIRYKDMIGRGASGK